MEFEPALENDECGLGVDLGLALLPGQAALAQVGVGFGRTEALVDLFDGQAEAAAQLVGEALATGGHFMRRAVFVRGPAATPMRLMPKSKASTEPLD
jgi:hypothetical protein